MCNENQTDVKKFLLVGFPSLYNIKYYFFSLVLFIYILIIKVNVLFIILVKISTQLQLPMYFFLQNLALADIFLTTNVIPKMLQIIFWDVVSIPFFECIAQFYFHSVAGIVECFLLSVMSYDRYLAICFPLHYFVIMDFKFQLKLATCSWFLAFLVMIFEMFFIWDLQFCGFNTIDFFFCDFGPLLELSSSDITTVVLEDFIFSIPVIISPFIFIVVTYVFIIITILKMASISGRTKTFSTCSSHLLIVCTYYGTLIAVYVVPSEGTSLNKFLSLLYIVVTPLCNPMIYSFRNQEIKSAIRKIF
ncbi:olfactory receptor 1468-like [Bufo bufo]|uniref:olfactory receptor 1468-like n=1 Tax=Bufo bufo TaxID=8384 RepID=UPI001ABEE525|nr:olfactory receptor 1468-like [Bufo bufo]